MAKPRPSDLLAILRIYEIAGELSSAKAIRDVKEYPARLRSSLFAFTFERTRYFLFYDNSANDDADYVLEQISLDEPSVKGKLVRNPLGDRTTYGYPYKGKDIYLIEVISDKKRLDLELASRYPDLSRSTIQKYIKAGYVTVNGQETRVTKTEVAATDAIALQPPEKETFAGEELPIIYIDDDVIVVNKPSGILTHSKGAMNDEFTVAEFFRRYTTHALETNRPGIVHRLDRDTSGVIIGARNDETARLLKEQFANRKVKKEYVAVVDGMPKVEKAVIDLPIGRNPATPSTFRVDPGGKSAQTTYEVLASDGKQSLVSLVPKTGRTHQLRVHMQYINTPIVGDRVYGRQEKAQRLFLHAHRLEITIPVSRRETFTAPLPDEFTKPFPGVENV